MKRHFSLLPMALCVSACLPVLAQQLPDSGALLQENARALPRPAPSGANPVQVAPPAQMPQSGGPRVVLRHVTITGNTRIPSAVLLAALGPVEGQSYDFGGLSSLAARLSAYYQQAGYPFARAYLPQQDMSNGELKVQILEGRYGKVSAHGEPAFVGGAEGFLSALPKGAIIESADLERVTLLLNDQSGDRTVPLVRPGEEVGTGDLLVEVQRDHRYKGEAGLDNYGTHATGRMRAHLSADADSPFMLGDQISVQALYTEDHMWFGSFAYAAPLGHRGLRGKASYTHSFYELAGSFAALGARGTADVASLGLSYPLVRSQLRNLTLSASLDHKKLHDRQGASATRSDKSSTVIPVNVAFDMRDQFIYAGITYGALSFVRGSLALDGESRALNDASARTAGGFSKLNFDLARIQSLNQRIDLYGRMSVQRAGANLDPSEKLGLGGVNGVRAYPNGEGYGDNGWLAQLEARYAMGPVVPFAFYDAGRVTLNKSPWTEGVNYRSLAGAGLGLRYAGEHWSANLMLAWRTRGGAAQSDDAARTPSLLAGASYRF
ncbi:ShlB/FhaC/HecB family hemolysin secretion/activation protein [Massilia sp. LXY-6]|uniref:ShlB/FhaC/HecB family hemolysin secretion/activation protein n=1 Tax=Massilia sp. LXY-6 TaxID=3379823 RepID=UPI003EE0053A